jgi:DNA-binding FadR family transcriptional regulator
MRNCLQFRISFEGEAAWHAARAGADRTPLTQAIERLEAGLTAEVIGTDDDYLFHYAVAQCTGNRFFVTVMTDLRESIMSGMDITRSFGSLRARVHAQHLEIHDAILSNDAEAAKSAMRRHLESAMRRAFEGIGD